MGTDLSLCEDVLWESIVYWQFCLYAWSLNYGKNLLVLCYTEFEHARDISNFPEAQPKGLHIRNSRLGLFIPSQAFCFSHGRKNLSCHQHVAGYSTFWLQRPSLQHWEWGGCREDWSLQGAKGFSRGTGLPCWGYPRCWWNWGDVFLTAVGLVPSKSQAKLSDGSKSQYILLKGFGSLQLEGFVLTWGGCCRMYRWQEEMYSAWVQCVFL